MNFGGSLRRYVNLLPPNHRAKREYEELLVAATGGLVALKLGNNVDVQAAIRFLEETLAKAEGRK